MATYLDPYGFLNARYARDRVITVLIRVAPRDGRQDHVAAMMQWLIREGSGQFTILEDVHHSIHWTTISDRYDVLLDDWMKGRSTHELFLLTDADTAFAFKMRFG
jgi:hypothetical protein